MEANTPRIDHRNLRTVGQIIEEVPSLTNAKLRWMLFHRQTNGLGQCVIRLGGRLYIDVLQFQENDLRRHGLRRNEGLILGRCRGRRLPTVKPGHLLTFAPTRSGKGAGCIIPNLLDHPGSVVVVDPKGENFAATAHYRAQLGPVHVLQPFSRDAAASRFNPIDFIRVGQPEETDDAVLVADMLVSRTVRTCSGTARPRASSPCFSCMLPTT